MTERPRLTPEQTENIESTQTEVFVREVEAVILAHDPEVIRVAAAVGASLPHFGVEGEKIVERHSLREKIRMQLGRIGTK